MIKVRHMLFATAVAVALVGYLEDPAHSAEYTMTEKLAFASAAETLCVDVQPVTMNPIAAVKANQAFTEEPTAWVKAEELFTGAAETFGYDKACASIVKQFPEMFN